ncbi:MAG: hypothetical protein GY842_10730, partial [bacterium]|nr:hypothetical protein [bacterium]
MMHASDGRSPKRRMSGWIKLLLVLVALAAFFGVVILIFDQVGQSALRAELEAIEEAGEPVTLEDLEARRKSIPDEQNGALVMVEVRDVLDGLSYPEDRELPLLGRARLPRVPVRLEAAVVERTRAFVAEHGDLVIKLRRMKDYPVGRFSYVIPVDPMAIFNAHPEWKTVRIAAKVLALDAMMQAL